MSSRDALPICGNVYDKYASANPIERKLVDDFLKDISDLYRFCQPTSVLEVGCGEGKLAQYLYPLFPDLKKFHACDIQLSKLERSPDCSIVFEQASIYDLPYEDSSFDLVVCCEVFEHLKSPAQGLTQLHRVAKNHVLLSTPWEPIWRILNMVRGKYWRDWGNTPGHIQHFSRSQLRQLAQTKLDILATRRPLPWTILLGSPRG